jgi:hypothetical protein
MTDAPRTNIKIGLCFFTDPFDIVQGYTLLDVGSNLEVTQITFQKLDRRNDYLPRNAGRLRVSFLSALLTFLYRESC